MEIRSLKLLPEQVVKVKWIKPSTLLNSSEELGFWQRALGTNPILTEPDLMRAPHS